MIFLFSTFRRLLFGLILLLFTAVAWNDTVPSAPQNAAPALTGRVLIFVGLPGDAVHEELFAATVKLWRRWLTGKLGFQSAEIRVLSGNALENVAINGAATRTSIQTEVDRLKQSLQPSDRLWVFFLGHANFDGEHVWFHLPGPDLNEEEIGKLFAGINCREQIFWMTTAESGRFVKSLSAQRRIVIAATRSSGEDNETEFPHALAALADRPAATLDLDKDGKCSVLELYYQIMAEVQTRYAADKRIPTEHAQLDDDGDGIGTERPLASDEEKKGSNAEGTFAHGTILPYSDAPPKAEPLQPSDRIHSQP